MRGRSVLFMLLSMTVVVICASLVSSSTLYSPWLIDTMNSADPQWGAFNTLIFVYNTADADVEATMVLRKVGDSATSTTLQITVPGKDTVFYSFFSLCQTSTSWYDPSNPNAPVRRGTLELDYQTGFLLGFVFRFKNTYEPTYSEPLFSHETGVMTAGDQYATDAIVGNVRYVPATGPSGIVQGSPTEEPCRQTYETQFTHVLTRDLAVMETEISRQMWSDLKAVQPTLPADPSYTPLAPTLSCPVNQPTWYETVLFANLLSVQNGLTRCYYSDAAFSIPIDGTNYTTGPFYCNFAANGYRLFTEGEWEYAARAGTTTPFSCNETNYTSGNCGSCTAGTHPTLEQYAVYCANYPASYSAPVGSKLSNPWNLKDMHGNVYEWCWDWYSGTYPGDITDYAGPGSGSRRVLRGGGWDANARHCRSARRDSGTPGYRGYYIGFRLLRSVN